jgi:phenylacetic acid degradation operon negative regulatory protein
VRKTDGMTSRPAPAALGVEPLTARSLLLTALLGTHPPRLPVRALVALGELFGFAEGTIRTALSRMTAGGEVETRDSWYQLGAPLRQRQASQDVGRRPAPSQWDGTWWVGIVDASNRTVVQRRAFRARMRQARMGELRPDLWLRPANIDGPDAGDDLVVIRGPIDGRDPVALAARLWDLDELAGTARALIDVVDAALPSLSSEDPSPLPHAFMTSVAVVHFLQHEPLLPRELVGSDWPADDLRRTYDHLDATLIEVMASFFTHYRD